jgi:hypothetical protein
MNGSGWLCAAWLVGCGGRGGEAGTGEGDGEMRRGRGRARENETWMVVGWRAVAVDDGSRGSKDAIAC